jgi:protein-S-isoprenylcysteine O-methyltransferase Ste14
MNWPGTLICLAMIASNVLVYKLHHRLVAQKPGPSPSTRQRYSVSWPTRLFKYFKVPLYLLVVFHVFWETLKPDAAPFHLLRSLLGLLLGLAGVFLLGLSLKALGNNFAPCNQGQLPNQVVVRGPYRFLSHPIYLSNLLMLTALGLVVWGWILPVVLVLTLFFYGFSIHDENKALAAMRDNQ